MLPSVPLVMLLTSPPIFFACFAWIMVTLFKDGRRFAAAILSVCVASALASTFVLKDIFKVARPSDALVTLDGWSYPSGHAVGAFVLAYAAFVAFAAHSHSSRRIALGLVFFGAALLVGLSRLYLGVHRPGEVAAGIALAGFYIFVAEFIFHMTGEAKRR